MVYSGISAYSHCGNLGPTHASVTLSYAPTDLKRLGGNTGWQTIDYAELFSNCTGHSQYPDIVNAFDKGQDSDWEDDIGPACGSVIDHVTNSGVSETCENEIREFASTLEYQSSHCFPYFPYPTNFVRLQSAWAGCVIDPINIIYDPPRVLTPRFALVSITTTDPGLTPSTEGASPASSTLRKIPSQTTPPLMFIPTSTSWLSNLGSSDSTSSNAGAASAYTTRPSIADPSTTDLTNGGLGSDRPSTQGLDGDDPNGGIQNTADPGNDVLGNGRPEAAGPSNSHLRNGDLAKSTDSRPVHTYSETTSGSAVTVAKFIPNLAPTFAVSVLSGMSLSGTITDPSSIVLGSAKRVIFGGSMRAFSRTKPFLPIETSRLMFSNLGSGPQLPSMIGSANPSMAGPASSAAVFQRRSSKLTVPWRILITIPLVILLIRIGRTAI